IALLTAAIPAHAEFGAVALNEHSAKTSFSLNYNTVEEAQEAALRHCDGCKIVFGIGPAQCVAVATGLWNSTAWASSARPTLDEAKLGAMSGCQKRTAQQCALKIAGCNASWESPRVAVGGIVGSISEAPPTPPQQRTTISPDAAAVQAATP